MATTQLSKGLLKSLQNIKGEVQGFIKENRLKNIKGQVRKLVNDAQEDLSKVVEGVDKDIQQNVGQLKSRFMKEKKQIEGLIDRVVLAELNKAKNFVVKQKNELQRLQNKLEKMADKKRPAKRVQKKKVAKKVR